MPIAPLAPAHARRYLWLLAGLLLCVALLGGPPAAAAQSAPPQAPEGKPHAGPGALVELEEPPPPPPPDDRQSTTGPQPPSGVVQGGALAVGGAGKVIPGVPSYIWHHGCGPTAAGMVLGYWDGRGFDIVPGSAASQTASVNHMMASNGHYWDYSYPEDYAPNPIRPDKSEEPAGDEHPHDSVADFMQTSWSKRNNYYGWSWLSDLTNSMEAYVEMVAPNLDATARYYTFEQFSWEQYKAEIDAGRPMVLLVDTGGNNGTDHFVTAFGYDDSSGTRYYGIYDTWDHSIHWHPWRQMQWGITWGVYSITTFTIQPVQPPPSNDQIAGAKNIGSLPYSDSMNTTWATAAASDPYFPCITTPNKGYHTVWYRLQPPVAGVATVTTNGSSYDTILAVWRGASGSLTPVACDDDQGTGTQSLLSFTAEIGQTYYIEVAGYGPANYGTLNLNITYDTGIFADVPVPGKEWMQSWIGQFYAAGITTGCAANPLQYCPEREVTRAEMAVFTLRALNYPNLPYIPGSGTGTFDDMPVAGKEWMEPWVEEFYDLGITIGCAANPLQYCPEREATRAEMAVFILRAKYGGGYQPPSASGTFADVPVAGKEWMEPWIEQFYAEGITTGCGTDGGDNLLYCPERPVTRAEMAVFILRAFDSIPSPPG